jgi:serralysin
MAEIVNYSPQGIIDKALFNFDAMGGSNFKLSGEIVVSISSPFTNAQFLNGYGNNLVWTPDVSAIYWSNTQVANINSILDIYKQFSNISFTTVFDNTRYTPAGAGLNTNSDINITLLYRSNLSWSGMSSINENSFGYQGSELDIALNTARFGSSDYSLATTSFGGHVLMHEIGHSLGLSHPFFASATNLTADYSATTAVGFQKLGFVINSAADMNKEYFSIMSYDNEKPFNSVDTYAQTPMILDVIALQAAYGAGKGSSAPGDNTFTPGSTAGVNSYRTYFDSVGNDSVNLSNYSQGAYIHLGTSIIGANELVGVTMNISDYRLMTNAQSPQSLRWLYGQYENAIGSISSDLIIGNVVNNVLTGNGGNDLMDGGLGIDTAQYSGKISEYRGSLATQSVISDTVANRDGIDTIVGVERLRFSDVNLAIDTAPSQSSGKAALLLGTVLPGKLALDSSKHQLIGSVISLFDQGYSLQSLSGAVLRLPIWDVLTGKLTPTTTDIASYLVNNVYSGNANQTIINSAILAMTNESAENQGAYLANLALSEASQSHIGLVGIQASGLAYTAS